MVSIKEYEAMKSALKKVIDEERRISFLLDDRLGQLLRNFSCSSIEEAIKKIKEAEKLVLSQLKEMERLLHKFNEEHNERLEQLSREESD